MEYIWIGVIILLVIFNSSINMLISNQKRMELKLDKILKHFDISGENEEYISDELKCELTELITQNKKVKAIKRLRDATGIGLKEAKDYIDRFMV